VTTLTINSQTTINNSNNVLFCRSACVNTTGPWVEILPSIQLKDISIQVDHKYQDDGSVVIWAVNFEGDVLCRKAVTAAHPQVSNLHQVLI
jgi:hypothetical protein